VNRQEFQTVEAATGKEEVITRSYNFIFIVD